MLYDTTEHCLNLKVNMIKDDGEVIHFNNPKVQASLSSNTFAVIGHAEIKRMCFSNYYHNSGLCFD